jgi:non-specific serine/threonine protein kinase/serine/threonine-protein kinase
MSGSNDSNDSNDFQRLEQYFHQLEQLSDRERKTRLAELAKREPDIYPQLLRMLADSTELGLGERLIDVLIDAGQDLSAESLRDPEEIGPYRLQKLIGEGGMGRVYLAEQSEPVRRRVALKLTRRGLDSKEAVARFRAERQALAVLEHPNIARVFDAGSTDGGRPWFAMEYIDGVPITRWAAERRLSLAQRIELLLPVCEAVQHAHAKGLIHRDLKPSNILVVDDGGIGRHMVIDFGIARVVDMSVDERTQATRLGELVGTPEYMSPEQASLGEIDIDTRSDIYSLGLVLYELLVGELPLSGAQLKKLGFQAMCQAIREGDTPRPSRAPTSSIDSPTLTWRSRLKGDLDSVLLKALAKDRDHRYGTAAAFAEDLRRYLANEPVLAQPPSMRYRAGKFVRRNRTLVGASAVVALALVAATAISSVGLLQARQAEQRAQVSAELARQEAERASAAQREAESQYELANAFLLGQRVYSDLLLEQFADEDGGQSLTDTLMERWRAQHANWQDSEDTATALSLALGRNFYFRRDYQSAQEIFEGWLEAGYGSEAMRAAGRELHASSLFDAGRRDEALPILREVLEDMETGIRRSAVDRFNIALRIAHQSRMSEDLDRAERLYEQRELEFGTSSQNAAQRIENLAGLMNLRRIGGDLVGSAALLEDMLQVYVDHPEFSFGRNIVHARLAELWLLDQGRAEESEQLARLIVTEDVEALGLNTVTSRGWYLLARSLIELDQLDEAEAALDSGLQVQQSLAADTTPGPEWTLASMLLNLERGDAEAARQNLAEIQQRVETGQTADPWPLNLELASHYLRLQTETLPAESRAQIRQSLPPEPTVDIESLWLHRRVVELTSEAEI